MGVHRVDPARRRRRRLRHPRHDAARARRRLRGAVRAAAAEPTGRGGPRRGRHRAVRRRAHLRSSAAGTGGRGGPRRRVGPAASAHASGHAPWCGWSPGRDRVARSAHVRVLRARRVHPVRDHERTRPIDVGSEPRRHGRHGQLDRRDVDPAAMDRPPRRGQVRPHGLPHAGSRHRGGGGRVVARARAVLADLRRCDRGRLRDGARRTRRTLNSHCAESRNVMSVPRPPHCNSATTSVLLSAPVSSARS